jgi:hypothetical protein
MPDSAIAASCSLDQTGLAAQLERYRRAGTGGRLLERSPRMLSVELATGTDPALVERAIAIERECCPFYVFHWDARSRRLSIAVTRREHEPALGAIARALGLMR